MRVSGHIAAVGALVALPLLWTTVPALARHHHHHHAKETSGDKTNSAAYPKAPGGTPAAGDDGKPVTPKSDASAKPAPAGKAGTESAPASTGTPSTSYPGAPTNTPSAGNGGKPVKP